MTVETLPLELGINGSIGGGLLWILFKINQTMENINTKIDVLIGKRGKK